MYKEIRNRESHQSFHRVERHQQRRPKNTVGKPLLNVRSIDSLKRSGSEAEKQNEYNKNKRSEGLYKIVRNVISSEVRAI